MADRLPPDLVLLPLSRDVGYVAEGMSYDDASAVLFERTRRKEPPHEPCPTMGLTERPRLR